jgi:hypothetical protein
MTHSDPPKFSSSRSSIVCTSSLAPVSLAMARMRWPFGPMTAPSDPVHGTLSTDPPKPSCVTKVTTRTASRTSRGYPLMSTHRVRESTWIRVPVSAWMRSTVEPPRPMTRPISCSERHCTVSMTTRGSSSYPRSSSSSYPRSSSSNRSGGGPRSCRLGGGRVPRPRGGMLSLPLRGPPLRRSSPSSSKTSSYSSPYSLTHPRANVASPRRRTPRASRRPGRPPPTGLPDEVTRGWRGRGFGEERVGGARARHTSEEDIMRGAFHGVDALGSLVVPDRRLLECAGRSDFHFPRGKGGTILFNSQITAEHTRPRGSGPWARRTTQAVVIEGSVRGCETNADAAG